MCGSSKGNSISQLNQPSKMCVLNDETIYISDSLNDRALKFNKNEEEAIIMAGGHGKGNKE